MFDDKDQNVNENKNTEASVSSAYIFLSSDVSFSPEQSCLSSKAYGDIHLTPNELKLLKLVISGTCKKETIQEEIWLNKGTIVSESSYHQLIKMLRRKLEKAGLPGDMIKTRPRYGVVFISPEKTLHSDTHDRLVNPSDEDGHRFGDSESIAEDREISNLNTNTKKKFNSRMYLTSFPVKIIAMIGVVFIASPPILTFYLMHNQPAFNEQLIINDVTYHYYSNGSLNRDIIMKKKIALQENINNVYVAINGPRVFIAECDGIISKEGKCQYEYYSSY